MRIALSRPQFTHNLSESTLRWSVALSTAVSATLFRVSPALAATCDPATSDNPISAGANCAKASGTSNDLTGTLTVISNTLIYVVGAVAVVFLILGGLRYVISNGDPKAVEAAKNTILYAVIGIVVAILSYAIVNFAITAFTK